MSPERASSRARATARSMVSARSNGTAPACASFDQYKNFEERGRHFASLVRQVAPDA